VDRFLDVCGRLSTVVDLSIKSIDLALYGRPSRVTSRINGYIRQTTRFAGDIRGETVIDPGDVTSRELMVLFPADQGYDYDLAVALNRSFDYGAARGVHVSFKFVD
jgi:hypothetical protein